MDINEKALGTYITTKLDIFQFIIPELSLYHWSPPSNMNHSLLWFSLISTFQTLQDKYNLPPQSLFTYRQLTSYLKKKPAPPIHLPGKVWAFLSSTSSTIKGISMFYGLLHDKGTFVKNSALKRSERDLNTSFSDSQWRQAIHYNQIASKSINYWGLSQKLHLR